MLESKFQLVTTLHSYDYLVRPHSSSSRRTIPSESNQQPYAVPLARIFGLQFGRRHLTNLGLLRFEVRVPQFRDIRCVQKNEARSNCHTSLHSRLRRDR
jgi:hypothetical protein